MAKEIWCGIHFLSWSGWDYDDHCESFFYGVEWQFQSMKKYNGNCVYLDSSSGRVEIYDGDGEKAVWKGCLLDIPEFIEAIKNWEISNE